MVLTANSLTKKFGTFIAVDDLDFGVKQGTLTSVIGPNGAGKTTFFHLLTGGLFPTTGTVQFLGEDVTEIPPYERCTRGMGRSFQITNIFPGLSVLENVHASAQRRLDRPWAFWRRREGYDDVRDHAEAVLQRVGLHDHIDRQASELAYGDKRRLELAITLAGDPELLLLDEPTAGMSPDETDITIDLIHDISKDHTILLIEHDMDVVSGVSDEIMVMNRGSKLVKGEPKEVLNDDRVQEAYLGGM